MLIPHDQLRPETLTSLIEEFVTRDGAVHGHRDVPVDQQIEAVRRQLKLGKAVVVVDEESESCGIMLREDARESLQRRSERHIEYDEPPRDE